MEPERLTSKQIDRMRCVIARTDSSSFCEYVLKTPEGKEIRQAQMHHEWHDLLAQHRKLILWGSVECGKCEVAGSKILLANGQWLPIEQIVTRTMLRILDPQTLRMRDVPAGPVVWNGVKAVKRIWLRSGRVIAVTHEHPLYGVKGWIHARDVVAGMYLGCARGLAPLGVVENDPGVLPGTETLFWDEVRTITDETVGTYALEVHDPAHCYLSSGVISHNSQQISIGYAAWKIGKQPHIRIAILSKVEDLAVKLVSGIYKILRSDAYRRVFPNVLVENANAHTIKVVGNDGVNPTVQAFAYQGSVMGIRTDLLIIDDPLDAKNTRTEEMREGMYEWYHNTLEGRLTINHQVVMVANAWHPRDMLHRLAAEEGWITRKYPIWRPDPKTGQMISSWPEQWPLTRIEAKKRDLRARDIYFKRQYECIAIDNASTTFKQAWIDKALSLGKGRRWCYSIKEADPDEIFDSIIISVDLATKRPARRRKTDHSAFVVTGVKKAPRIGAGSGEGVRRRRLLWIEDGVFHGPAIIRKIEELYRRFSGIVWCETNACFPGDMRVMTSEGYRPIRDVAEGDLVLTHKGRWRRVVGIANKPYNGELVRVQPSGGLPLCATPNHEFFVRNAGRLPGKNQGVYRPVGDPGWLSCGLLSHGVRPSHSGRSAASFYVAAPIAQWASCAPTVQLRRYDVTRNLVVDEDLAVLIGLFLAEGSFSDGNRQVSFTFHRKEKYLRDFVREVATRVFSASSQEVERDGECTAVIVNSAEIWWMLKACGKKNNKKIPWDWMGWPLPIRLAIVRGWLLGDGCLTFNNVNSGNPMLVLSGETISRDLAYQVRMTLAQAGLRPAMSETEPTSSLLNGRVVSGKHNKLKVSLNHDDTETLLSWCGCSTEQIRWSKFNYKGTKKSPSRMVIENDTIWAKPYKVTREDFDGLVYDLQVEEDSSYVVEDTAVHNSQIYITDFLRESQLAIPVHDFETTGSNKHDEEFGVESLGTEMNNGYWEFPELPAKGHLDPPIAFEKLVTDMTSYSPGGHTGDRLMALWIGREAARLGNTGVRETYTDTGRR